MKVVVLISAEQQKELNLIQPTPNIFFTDNKETFFNYKEADVFANFLSDAATEDYSAIHKTIIINSVVATIAEIKSSASVIRINGWATFLQRSKWEVAGPITDQASSFFSLLNKETIPTADEPGLVAARAIAMIINEAYFALEDSVSSKAEIDIAMKLGTNYPHGPFEWADKIGLNNIYQLLEKLSWQSNRYTVCGLLKKEATA